MVEAGWSLIVDLLYVEVLAKVESDNEAWLHRDAVDTVQILWGHVWVTRTGDGPLLFTVHPTSTVH